MKPLLASCIIGAGLLLVVTVVRAAADSSPVIPAHDSAPTIPPVKKTFWGDKFLGLENGSLVESIYFWHVWMKLHPDEVAIVLITSPAAGKDGQCPPVTAVTVYSTNGIVLAHTIDHGKVPLKTLQPDDLRKYPGHCLDEYFKTVAKLPLKPVPLVGTPDEQMQRAFAAFHDPKKMPDFPVARASSPGSLDQSLVFDWNDTHYTWRPSTGALREDPPKDPITGRPLLCVKHGDLVESLIFVHDYQKLHPEEKAGLLFAPNDAGQGLDTIGLAAAAYTVKGVVHVRGYYFGDLVLDKRPHSFQPDDLATLSKMYNNLLVRTIGEYYEETHSNEPVPDSYWDNLYNTLPSVFPQSLPGDTDEMQENRIAQRADEAGIPCEITLNKTRGRLVVLHWQSQRFSYSSDWNYYNGDWDPNDLAQLNSAEKFLGIENGSLLESIYFRTVWIKLHPAEDAIVLVTSPAMDKNDHYPPVTAVTVYTNKGRLVWAHSTDYGTVRLRTLDPDDLLKNAGHCLDEYLKIVAKLPRKPVPLVGKSDAQVQRAFNAVHDPKTMPYFPVATMDVPGSIKMPDGKIQSTDTKAIVFDWNNAHYAWTPATGAVRENLPIEPLTGRPYLCVEHGDVVESLVFVNDYLKTHPKEKAVLLYAPTDIGRGISTNGLAAAAYSLNGIVHIRGYFNQDIVPKLPSHTFTPADLDRPEILAELYQSYRAALIASFNKQYAVDHPHGQPLSALNDELYTTLHPAFPTSLTGDTPEMEENRFFQRAVEAGIDGGQAISDKDGRIFVFYWRAERFCYTGDLQQTRKAASWYDGVWNPNIMNRLTDAILFAHDFKPRQPGETVVVLPYRELGLWDIVKAVAVYIRDGKVWVHNPQLGEILIPNANPADLGNPARRHLLRLAANSAIHSVDSAKTFENAKTLGKKYKQELQDWVSINHAADNLVTTHRHVYEMMMRPGDMSQVEVPSVFEKLKAAGIDCQLSATTAERGTDGAITHEARPSLGFAFQGVRYTYGPESYCSAADNLILDP
ncbi:MAG TPA: hypothetical protein VK815_11650 [Candidatus Acidoferrales bacterium]|nr:hypothetical protein [Candidatus Acidoferrales bacterium]